MVQNSLADLPREEGRSAEARQLFVQIVDSPGVTPRLRLSALTGLGQRFTRLAGPPAHEVRVYRSPHLPPRRKSAKVELGE
jgi:hypothetical protein